MKPFLLVGIGGFLGSIARYSLHLIFTRLLPGQFPYGTFTANILGCLFIGILFGIGLKQELITEETKLLLAVGFCGGFTTFSSFSLENINLIQAGNYYTMIAYFFGSIIAGFAATLLGIYLFK